MAKWFSKLLRKEKFLETKPEIYALPVESIEIKTEVNGPEEELFLPIYDRRVYDELAGNALPGITYRVNSTDTASINLPGLPTDSQGLTYDMKQFRIGLTDGYLGTSPAHNLNSLEKSFEIEKALAYPLRIQERIACNEAKKIFLEANVKEKEEEIEKIETEKQQCQPKLDNLLQKREKLIEEEIAFEEQLIEERRKEQLELEKQEKEQRRSEEEMHRKEEELRLLELEQRIKAKEAETEEDEHKHNRLAKFFTGLFLLIGGLIFLVADVSLSIAAIYALGFQDVGDIRWADAVFNPSIWATHWEGVFVCFGIASITFFFKYLYERLIYSNVPFRMREKLVLSFIALLCVVTVGFLGKIRADYLINNVVGLAQKAAQNENIITQPVNPSAENQIPQPPAPNSTGIQNDLIFGVPKRDAFLAMFLTTILFPFVGALMLTEGLNRTTGLMKGAFKINPKELLAKFTPSNRKPLKKEFEHKIPERLENEIKQLQKKIEVLEMRKGQNLEDIRKARKEKEQIEKLIIVWQDAIKAYEVRWDQIGQLEKLLYIHGYEQGRILRASRGAYRVISGILANELTAQSSVPKAILSESSKDNRKIDNDEKKVSDS